MSIQLELRELNENRGRYSINGWGREPVVRKG